VSIADREHAARAGPATDGLLVPDLPGPEAMTDIEVRCDPTSDGWQCDVRIADDRRGSAFDVTSRDPAAFLPPGAGEPTRADVERLVIETFHFLLEREPVSSILPSFDLTVVARYFPDYPAEVRRRLAR